MSTIETAPTRTIEWLMAGDPAIRWQVLRDLLDAPAPQVRAERARVATEGFGATLLALQTSDGRWGGVAWNRGWSSTMHALILLREFGVDPDDPRVRAAVTRVAAHVTWAGCAPPECDGHGFFAGEIEPCINGQVAAAGACFRQDVHALVRRLASEQLADGGWNCDAEFGSTRSSFNTTLCVLEALLEYRQAFGADATIATALARGHEYLLERRLFRRRSTGEVITFDRKMGVESRTAQPSFTRFAFPTWWHYDVLWALDYLRRAGVAPDSRVDEAAQLVADAAVDGRWSPTVTYPGEMLLDLGERDGQPSRWITLRALRVLRWYRQKR
jgi:hypothetical protein